MDDFKQRLVGYGLGSLAIAGLAYAGFIYEAEADPMTLLGSARVQLQLASSYAAKGKDGREFPGRKKLIQEARLYVERAEKQIPDHVACYELRGMISYMEGDYAQAARIYAEAQSKKSCNAETRDLMLLNQSRMLRAAKRPAEALRVLQGHEGRFVEENIGNSQIEKGEVLAALGRKEEACQVVAAIVEDAKDSMTLVAAGHLLEAFGETQAAGLAYGKAVPGQPLANYYCARLKVRLGEYDKGLDLLERAIEAQERRVRILLKRDQEAWAPVAKLERFRSLVAVSPGKDMARPGH